VDSNVTTIITGVVLYVIGTDQIKGFAVTLILGILTSMFTAVFCSHVLFDIAERRKWITQLNFSSIIGETNIDFLSKGFAATMVSLVLIGIGAFAVYKRGESLLNIDFTGGSSVTMAVQPDAKLTQAKVEAALLKTDMAEKSLTVVERGDANDGTRFSVTSSIDDKDAAKKLLVDTFGKDLQGYLLKAGEVKPYSETGFEGSQVELTYNNGPGFSNDDAVSYETPRGQVIDILKAMGNPGIEPILENPDYQPGSNQRFKTWTLKLPLPVEQTQELVTKLESQVAAEPFFPLASKVGGAVAGDMKSKALQAMIASILGVIIYLWFRFESVAYGLAATVAVVHDVLVTLGFLALSYYLVQSIPGLAQALQIESFQLSLTIVAALLTIIGYSLNDTIVIFDRIREVKGKSPKLTPAMVNLSVNQTLSRTILTSLTVFLTVVILYFFGGPGIHGFAFAMVIGVLAGTYSTVFIACPVLLWLVNGRQSAPVATQSAAA
jgi:SecD/SecF fusion protein